MTHKKEHPMALLFGVFALFGAVLCFFAIGAAQGTIAGRDQISLRAHYDDLKRQNLQACPQTADAEGRRCLTEAIEKAHEDSLGRQDLFAQQDMAKWAFWMMLLTGGSVAISAIGVWLVARNLEETRKAVEEASAATNAMLRQNEISEISQRPWLRIEVKPEYVEVFGDHIHIAYNLVFENIGHSVAKNIRYYTNVWYVGEISPEKVFEYLDLRYMSAEPVLDGSLLPRDSLVKQRIDSKILPGPFMPFEPEQAAPLYPLLHIRCFYDWGDLKDLETSITLQIGTKPKPGQMTPGPFLASWLGWPSTQVSVRRQPPERIV